jgi:hypothetical protein
MLWLTTMALDRPMCFRYRHHHRRFNPLTLPPSDTSGPSRTRRRKREKEIDSANEVEGKRSRTASRRARGEY